MKRLLPLLITAVALLAATPTLGQSFGGPAIIQQPTTPGHCVKIATTGGNNIVDAGADCGTGSGTVTSISNSDGTLSLSPNPITGAGTIGVNLGHANTWTASQKITDASLSGPDLEVAISTDTVSRVAIGLNTVDIPRVSFGPGGASNRDLFLERAGAANLRFGGPDSATPISQTQSVQNVLTGTSNTAGANRIIAGSQGTGTGAGGSILFQTAPAGSTGSTQNALATILGIDTTGAKISSTASGGLQIFNTADQTTNTEFISLNFSGGTGYLRTQQSGSGVARDLNISAASGNVQIGNPVLVRSSTSSSGSMQVVNGTSANGAVTLRVSGTLSASSGSQTALLLDNTINQSGTAGFNIVNIAPTLTSVNASSTNLALNVVAGHPNLTGQLRVGYDNSNYLNVLVDSSGNSNFNSIGNYAFQRNGTTIVTYSSTNGLLMQSGTGARLNVGAAGSAPTINGDRSAGNAGLGASSAGNATIYASNGTGGGAVNVLDAAYTGVSIMGATLGTNALAVTGTATFSGSVVGNGFFYGGFSTNGPTAGVNSNLQASSGTNFATTTDASMQLDGSTNTNYRIFFNGATVGAIGVGNSYAKVILSNNGVTEAASGTHPLLANLAIKAPIFTDGTATTTDATSLYIEGPPTGITATNGNTALWVASGISRFAGSVQTTGGTLTSLGSAATAGAGARNYITDGTACTFGTTATGGGSTKCPVWSDGTNWIYG